MLVRARPPRSPPLPWRTALLCAALLLVDHLAAGPVLAVVALPLLLLWAAPALLLRSVFARGVPPRPALRVLLLLAAVYGSLTFATTRRDGVRAAAAPLISAAGRFHADHGVYPDDLSALVEEGYLAAIPKARPWSPVHEAWRYYRANFDHHAHLSSTSAIPGGRTVFCLRDHAWID